MALLLPRRKAGAVDISTVFSTDLYTGNSSTQTITNGIDLAGEGGLVWIKERGGTGFHYLFDTERGDSDALSTNSTNAEQDRTSDGLTSFNSDGYILDNDWYNLNTSPNTYAAWTFRKSPSFFDVVTYTGTGSRQTISHNLGVTPGMIVVKQYAGSAREWFVYHRSNTANPETDYLVLNNTDATVDATFTWNDTAPTDTEFTLGSGNAVNQSGGSFVAYLFAHDTTDNGVIQCGSYTGNGSTTGPTVTLGWEPQWVMIKKSSASGTSWLIFDNQRDATNPRTRPIEADTSDAEGVGDGVDFTATGFQLKSSSSANNASGAAHVYMAIRKEGT